MFELVVLWCTGEMEIYSVGTLKQAEEARVNMLLLFGDQIDYCDWRVKR